MEALDYHAGLPRQECGCYSCRVATAFHMARSALDNARLAREISLSASVTEAEASLASIQFNLFSGA